MMRGAVWPVLVVGSALSMPARTEVIEATVSGFSVRQMVQMAAPPERVYAALVNVGSWWSADHTYSGSAANLRFEAKAGGCWCETLPNAGEVRHMTVVQVVPNKRIVLEGALGPLQSSGVAGAMTWQLKPQNGGTEFALVYNVGGYAPGGLVELAGGVDGVLRAQVDRLKRLIETGKPTEPAKPG